MAKGKPISYSEAELSFISANREMPRRELTAAFNERFGRSVMQNNISALCKRKGWMTGRTGFFAKGMVPWNASVAGTGRLKANSGSFKKGHCPKNIRPVGAERTVKGVVWVKVAEPNVWRMKSYLVWEAAGRKLDKGFLLLHVDGDFTNNTLENLMPVRRADLAKLNKRRFATAPEAVRLSMVAVSRLDTETKRREGGLSVKKGV